LRHERIYIVPWGQVDDPEGEDRDDDKGGYHQKYAADNITEHGVLPTVEITKSTRSAYITFPEA
jgi:hypothetical protein